MMSFEFAVRVEQAVALGGSAQLAQGARARRRRPALS